MNVSLYVRVKVYYPKENSCCRYKVAVDPTCLNTYTVGLY